MRPLKTPWFDADDRLLPARAAAIPPPDEAGGDAEVLTAPALSALFSLDCEPRRTAGWCTSLPAGNMKRLSPSQGGWTRPVLADSRSGGSSVAGVGAGGGGPGFETVGESVMSLSEPLLPE